MAYVISIVLIIFSALFSGLNLGLLSLNKQELKRKMALGDKNAEKVYEVRKRGNLLLCTLLIGNVVVNAVLAVFLGSITTGVMAVIITTALIVVFGEIVPQALFSRFALPLGAKIAWLVKIFIIVLFPICWPLAWALNKTFGDEMPTVYSKQELQKIIEEHGSSGDSEIDAEEEQIIRGALTFSDKKVRDVMTPRSIVKAFEESSKIDEKFINKVKSLGLSRFPVYRKDLDRVVGVLYVRELLDKKIHGKPIGDVCDKHVHYVSEEDRLDDAFSMFIESRYHFSVVRDEFGSFAGVVTLEDVLEEIVRVEIVDEHDQYIDLRAEAKKRAQTKKKN